LKRLLPLAVLAAVVATCPSAEAKGWEVELNGAKVQDLSGAELGLGYDLGGSKFRLTPIVGALLYQGDNDRYRDETLSNGRRVCRDRTNGQFADKENCNNLAARAYGKLEAGYRLSPSLELAAGVRVGGETTPYGAISVLASDKLALKGFAGKDYYGAGLVARF
jgi:hypothetical protein